MLSILNGLLEKNTGLTAVSVVLMFAISMFTSLETQEGVDQVKQDVENISFGYEYKLISNSLHGINDSSDIVGLIRRWDDDGWGAQIAAVQVLCEGRGRDKLVALIGSDATVDSCRIVK